MHYHNPETVLHKYSCIPAPSSNILLHGGASVGRVVAAQASEGRRRHRRWAKLGPKQKRVGRLDGPPWRGGLRWARPENENKTGNHMGFNGARAELRWAVEKFLFKF
jgi:hypothetical protein